MENNPLPLEKRIIEKTYYNDDESSLLNKRKLLVVIYGVSGGSKSYIFNKFQNVIFN